VTSIILHPTDDDLCPTLATVIPHCILVRSEGVDSFTGLCVLAAATPYNLLSNSDKATRGYLIRFVSLRYQANYLVHLYYTLLLHAGLNPNTVLARYGSDPPSS